LLLFFTFSFLFKTDHSFDQDLGRHIKLGEIIWNTKSIPKTNLFSYTNPDFPFINTHWLFEVIAYFGQTIGLQAFLALKIIIILTSVWLTLKIIPKENRVLLLPIGFIFLHVLRERAELRPEIFSFLFTALTLYILTSFLPASQKLQRGERKQESILYRSRIKYGMTLLFLLPPIQLIWINTHIYFFAGLTLQAIFLLALIRQNFRSHMDVGKVKTLALVLGLSVAASLINPNGTAGVLYPLNVTKNYGYTIVENQTMFFLESINFRDPNFLFVRMAILIIVLSLIVGFIRKKLTILSIMLSCLGLALALLNVRSFPYLVFLSLPAVLANFGQISHDRSIFVRIISPVLLLATILLLFESIFYLNGNYYRYKDEDNQPVLAFIEGGRKAMDFVIKNNLEGPIFNNFDIGSYISYRSYPKLKVFVDGRPEAFPKEFFANTYIPVQYDYNKFKQLEEKLGIQTVIFSHTDQTPWGTNFLQQIVKDTDWKLVFIDDFVTVFIKETVAVEKNLNPINLAALSAGNYQFASHASYLRLGYFLLKTQNTASGAMFLQKALQIFPDSPISNSLMSSLTGQSQIFW